MTVYMSSMARDRISCTKFDYNNFYFTHGLVMRRGTRMLYLARGVKKAITAVERKDTRLVSRLQKQTEGGGDTYIDCISNTCDGNARQAQRDDVAVEPTVEAYHTRVNPYRFYV